MSPRRHAVAAALACLVGLSPLLASSATASTVVGLPTVNGLFIQRWSPTTMANTAGQVTQQQAVTIAQTFDVITAKAQTFTPYLSQMRAANPNLVVLTYENGALARTATEYPSSWYARDVNGKLIQANAPGVFTPGNYLMDMSNPNWLAASGKRCATDRAADGYDGCYFGMLSLAIFTPNYLNAQPIYPPTGQVWTKQEWISALQNAVAAIRSANPGVIITGNTVGNGGTYFDTNGKSMRPVLDLEDAGQMEVFLRGGTTPITTYPTESVWLNQINLLVDAGSRGDRVLAQTKIWISATAHQIDDWHKYTVASFLMGTNGLSYLNFSTGHTMSALTADSPYDRVDVGTPTTSFSKRTDGVYRRDFTRGISLVNPTPSTTTVLLGNCYVDLDGVMFPAGSSITLGPNQGDVLVHSC